MKTKKIIWIGGLFSALLIIMNACYYDQVLPVEKPAGDVGNVTFSKDIISIFNASCNVTGCHSAGGQKPNLTPVSAYSSLTNGGYIDKTNPENSLIYQWMKGDKGTAMPPSGPNASYNAKVLAWIKQGALDN